MANDGSEIDGRNRGQGGPQDATLSGGWLIGAMLVLSLVFPFIAHLLAAALGVSGGSHVALTGFILAILLIPAAAPRSFKQLGLVMAVVAVGGSLAMLIVLAAGTLVAGTLAEGLWGDLLATALAAVGGGGFIALVYRFLGLGRWQSAPGDRA